MKLVEKKDEAKCTNQGRYYKKTPETEIELLCKSRLRGARSTYMGPGRQEETALELNAQLTSYLGLPSAYNRSGRDF